jgi:ketosteroid isomerase-like protein
MRAPRLAIGIVVAALAAGAPARAQDVSSSEADGSSYYDFWPGAWYQVSDSGHAATPTFVVRRDVNPTAFLEEWLLVIDGKPSRSTGYRAWDAAAGRWSFLWVSDLGHVQIWESREVDGHWVIERPFEQEGRRFLSRQAWIPDGPDRVTRTIWRSFDEGRTWETRIQDVYERGPAPSAGLSAEELEDLRALETAYAEAWEQNDRAAVMAVVDDDAVLIPSGMEPIAGRHAIEAFWWPEDGPATTVTSYTTEIDEIVGSGDVAWVRGRGSLSFRWEENGAVREQTSHSVFLMTARRGDDGAWKLETRMWHNLPAAE